MLSMVGWLLGRKKNRSLLFEFRFITRSRRREKIPRLKNGTQLASCPYNSNCRPSHIFVRLQSRPDPRQFTCPLLFYTSKNKFPVYCTFRLSTRLPSDSFVSLSLPLAIKTNTDASRHPVGSTFHGQLCGGGLRN